MADDKIGEIKLNIISLFIISIIILGFVITFALALQTHYTVAPWGGTAFYANEDVTRVFNITINNNNTAIAGNISEINVTLSNGLVFIAGTNGTSNATIHTIYPSNFTNTSTVLTWTNNTVLIGGDNYSYIWFNATATTPGNYTITIRTSNITSYSETNFTLLVNDTTAPAVNVSGLLNYANMSHTSFNFSLNVTDNLLIDTCLYSLNNGVNNYTMSNITNVIYNATNSSLSSERMYNVTFYCNDSTNNLNNSETRFFKVDTTKPGVSIVSPTGLNYTLSTLDFNVSINENSSFCKYTINDWVTNVTMPAKNLTYFNFTNTTMADTNSATTRFWCNDTAGNINNTEIITFGLDDNPPGIIITEPTINDSNYSASALTFSINSTDNIMLSSCWFSISNGVVNTTLANTTAYTLSNTTAVRFYATNNSIPEGTYTAMYYCNDTFNNLNYSERRTFNIDTTAPRITITEPGNSSYDRNLKFNITGDTNMSFCKVSIDNWVTNLTMTKGAGTVTNTSFNLTYYNIPSASYTARFWCNDSANNFNDTATVNFVVSYFHFNGTIYDLNGTAVNNTNITVTIQDGSWSQVWYNSTASNLSGWFNLTLPGNVSWMYQVSIKHMNYTSNFVDKVGQTIPLFPYREFSLLASPKFYLKEAGTINISVINSSAHNTNFSYFVKDAKTGFQITDCVSNAKKNNTLCYVPKNRNYTIMIFPSPGGSGFVPVTFEWTNFSSSASHNITSGGLNISFYNATTGVVTKVFNVTQSLITVIGYTKNSSSDNFTGWDEFTVIPFLAEGDKNYISKTYGILPYNASVFRPGGNSSDVYNGTNGYYNITLPYAPAETTRYILFASVKNYSAKSTGLSAGVFGGYRNVTVSTSLEGFNFTMYGLLGSNASVINMTAGTTPNGRTVNTTMFTFTFVNATNGTVSGMGASVEVTLNYSAYGATQFIFMEEIGQTGTPSINLPLLNVTGFEEMNIFSKNFAPKRLDKKTALQINTTSNISLSTFNPKALDGTTGASISIAMYMSNSTCDVPNPSDSCLLTSSSNMASFNPLSAIVGGGAISFRMGMGGVLVHYVNVDMLASGPPDALFEDNNDVTEAGTSSGFGKVMRFGSQGPTIYDYVLISLPYTEGSSSQTGLDEDSQVNVSIANFYDENWNIIWNASQNGTNVTSLAGNLSHYSAYKNDWEILMKSNNNCTSNASIINQTNVCYIDTTNNRIWIRIPHFSGTGPSVSGTAVVASATATAAAGGGGGGTAAYWTSTTIVNDEQFKTGFTKALAVTERVKVSVSNPSTGESETHYVGVVSVTSNSITINVSSTPQQAKLSIGDVRKFDVIGDGYYDLSVKLNSIADDKADLTVKEIREKIAPETVAVEEEAAVPQVQLSPEEDTGSSIWLWILIIIVVVVIVGVGYWMMRKKG